MSFADLESRSQRSLLPSKNNKALAADGDGTRALIFQVTTAVTSYRRLLNSLGTPKDTPLLRHQLSPLYFLPPIYHTSSIVLSISYVHFFSRSQNTSLHILQLAKDAKHKLQLASAADSNNGISANKRIADAKLAKDFAAIMEEFRKLQNLAIQREMTYAPIIPQNVVHSSYTTGETSSASDKMPGQRALLAESKRREMLQLDNEIVFNEAIIEEREHAIQEIQQQIGEVNEMFKDLAVLVHEQGATIDEIDSNIENSVAATAEAKTELVKVSKTQKSNSSLVCLLLVIFGIVLLIVIIVLVA